VQEEEIVPENADSFRQMSLYVDHKRIGGRVLVAAAN